MDPSRWPNRSETDYPGKTDYQGNRDVFEMPENQKPAESPAKLPLKQLAGAIILMGLIVLVIIAIYSMLRQSGSFL